jgi:hypothetical protein
MSDEIKYIAHRCPDGTVITGPEDLNTEGAKVEIIGKGPYGNRVEISIGDFLSGAARLLADKADKTAAASVAQRFDLAEAFERGDWREAFGIAPPAPETTEDSEEDTNAL